MKNHILKKLTLLTLIPIFFHIYPALDPDLQQSKLFSTTLGDDPIAAIVNDIDEVESDGYIGIETQYFTNESIRIAANNAADRGASVRVFAESCTPREHWMTQSNFQKNLSENYKLWREKIDIREIEGHHAKCIVIKKSKTPQNQNDIVYIGSLNATFNSPANHEIMVRYADEPLRITARNEQKKIGKVNFTSLPKEEIDLQTRCLLHSECATATSTKRRCIKNFKDAAGADDYLYLAALTLNDPTIVEALIKAKSSNKPLKIILDGSNLKKPENKNCIRALVEADIEVYIFNGDGSKKTPANYPKMMHIKGMICQCNGVCQSLVSTANLHAKEVAQSMNYDLWEPDSSLWTAKLKRVLDNIIGESKKLLLDGDVLKTA